MAKLGIALGSGPRDLGFESRHSDQIIGIRFYAGSDFFFPDTMLDLIKENFPELVCHCEPVTDVTGVAIPIDTQNGH